MYNGRTKFVNRRIVVNRRTGIAGVVGDDSDELSEVAVNARFVAVPPKYEPPDEYDYPVIEVTGSKIPWWMWGVGGALALSLLSAFRK
jgi:hypothetical protein